MNFQPIELNDFSGGFTDNYLNGALNKCELMDNVTITSDKHPKSRPGSQLLDSTYYQVPDGAVRIGTLLDYDNGSQLLIHNGRKLNYVAAGWQTLTGPTGNHAWNSSTDSTHIVHFGTFKKQLFLMNDAGSVSNDSFLQFVYRDQAGNLQLRTAGLPEIPETANFVSATALASLITLANEIRTDLLAHLESGLAVAISLANNLKTKLNAHFADTVQHLSADAAHTIGTANATNLATLVTLTTALVAKYNLHEADSELGAAWAYHRAQKTSTNYFQIAYSYYALETPSDLANCLTALSFLQTYFNYHDNDVVTHNLASGGRNQSLVATASAMHAAQDTTASAKITAPVATDFTTLVTLAAQLQLAYQAHYDDSKRSAPTIHKVTSQLNSVNSVANSALSTLSAPTTYDTLASVLNDMKTKLNTHVGDADIHSSNAFAPIITSSFVTGVTYGPYITRDMSAAWKAANLFKQRLNNHKSRNAASLQPHKLYAGYSQVTAADATDDATFTALLWNLRFSYGNHVAYDEAGIMHYGASSDLLPGFPETGAFAAVVLSGPPFDDWNGGVQEGAYALQVEVLNDLISHYNIHEANVTAHNGALYADLDPVNVGTIELGTYLYAFHYQYTYHVGTTLYEINGPVHELEATDIPVLEDQAAVIQGIPSLANTTATNYDTSNLKIKIARTTKNGTQFYYVGEVTNGTTTFTDSTTDESLVQGVPIYTSGGVVDNDPRPSPRRSTSARAWGTLAT
jgi:hypothetical protein